MRTLCALSAYFKVKEEPIRSKEGAEVKLKKAFRKTDFKYLKAKRYVYEKLFSV